jgi:hypothetical protein
MLLSRACGTSGFSFGIPRPIFYHRFVLNQPRYGAPLANPGNQSRATCGLSAAVRQKTSMNQPREGRILRAQIHQKRQFSSLIGASLRWKASHFCVTQKLNK